MSSSEIFDGMLEQIGMSIERLDRCMRILSVVINTQPIGILKISELTGMPEHIVRYSLRIMQRYGIIEPSRTGAIVSPSLLDSRERLVDEIAKIEEQLDETRKRAEHLLLSGTSGERRIASKKEKSE
ncbi:MAG: transcriptional regulator [Candidatus Thermoplasmatota archaeon]|nr:transcriptional regulator [Candidatus Thermoplasmatota archaeon]